MADVSTKDLSEDDAKAKAGEAITNNAKKIVLEKQSSGAWTLTVTSATG